MTAQEQVPKHRVEWVGDGRVRIVFETPFDIRRNLGFVLMLLSDGVAMESSEYEVVAALVEPELWESRIREFFSSFGEDPSAVVESFKRAVEVSRRSM